MKEWPCVEVVVGGFGCQEPNFEVLLLDKRPTVKLSRRAIVAFRVLHVVLWEKDRPETEGAVWVARVLNDSQELKETLTLVAMSCSQACRSLYWLHKSSFLTLTITSMMDSPGRSSSSFFETSNLISLSAHSSSKAMPLVPTRESMISMLAGWGLKCYILQVTISLISARRPEV